jgi:protein-disulfide isomerase
MRDLLAPAARVGPQLKVLVMSIRSLAPAFLLGGLVALSPVAGLAQQRSLPAQAGPALSPRQRAEVVKLIREELVADPSILREAIASLQADDQERQASAQSRAISASKQILFHNPADPEIGNPTAPVAVVEFYDTRCPYCRVMRPEFYKLVKKNPNVRVIFKDIPILGPDSVVEAKALLAAKRQGKYAEMQQVLMTSNEPPTEQRFRALATRLGLNPDRLIKDMNEPAIASQLKDNDALAQALGINGTPAIVIGTQLVPGAVSLDDLEKLVAQAG